MNAGMILAGPWPDQSNPVRTGKGRSRRTSIAAGRGFSLIELAIVVTIVSVLSLSLVLGLGAGGLFPGARANDPDHAAQKLAVAVAAARDRALLSRQTGGLRPRADGWVLMRHDTETGQWHDTGRSEQGMRVSWIVSGTPYTPAPADPGRDGQGPTAPPVRFLADGRTTPFTARFAGGRAVVACVTDGANPLRCQPR